MKKLISVLLAIMVLCSCALAEDETFTFVNGAKWGMSPDDIEYIEGTDFYLNDVGGDPYFKEYDYENRQLSKYTATRAYLFSDDELSMIVYVNISSSEAKDFKYLRNAIASVYGEAQPLSDDEFNALGASLGSTDQLSLNDGAQWTVNSDTHIMLMYEALSGIALFYVDANFGKYDTTGI